MPAIPPPPHPPPGSSEPIVTKDLQLSPKTGSLDGIEQLLTQLLPIHCPLNGRPSTCNVEREPIPSFSVHNNTFSVGPTLRVPGKLSRCSYFFVSLSVLHLIRCIPFTDGLILIGPLGNKDNFLKYCLASLETILYHKFYFYNFGSFLSKL